VNAHSIVRVAFLAAVLATASGCAAFSDGLSEAPGSLALPDIPPASEPTGVSADATQPGLELAQAPPADAAPSPVKDADASAGPSTEKGTDEPAKEPTDEFYDPFAKKEDVAAGEESDPWEGFNTIMFEFNRKLDKYVLKPVAQVYDKVVPNALQKGISNLYYNDIHLGPRLLNNIFQAKFKGAGIELSRFLINATIGLGGLFDPAKHWLGLETPQEDTGQTLAVYGIPSGPYLVLPFLPPLTVRDFFGAVMDFGLNPVNYFLLPTFEIDDWPSAIAHKNRDTTTLIQLGRAAEEIINERSLNLEKYQGVEEATVDLYAAVRNAYLQKRARAIRE
jgi:phospholipid-binding lipoprotein MlaA